jgi:methanogenic corrinoid protein MtbC1
MMYNNHRHHARFMANVFRFNSFRLLALTVPWVYRAYRSRGFSYDYFPAELTAWIGAVKDHVSPAAEKPITAVYGWLLERHRDMVRLSQEHTPPFPSPHPDWASVQKDFLSALLEGAVQKSLDLADRSIGSADEVPGFYLHVIEPSMYEIGACWERGEISVAQEHLATAISSRVMAALYPRFVLGEQTKGRAVVTTVSEEFHELGAWMVADLLALDGWEVTYLGANTPVKDLLDMVSDRKPDLLALSSAMPFNLDSVQESILAIRGRVGVEATRIMVGGRVFRDMEDLWPLTGADGWARDAREAAVLAATWWEEAEGR